MSLWRPASGCGVQCVDAAAHLSRARRAGRLLALVGVLVAAVAVLPVLPARRRMGGVRAFARAGLRALGVRLDRRGALPVRPALVVANHVSWLDILVVLAAGRCRLVAKTEVRGWPVIGALAAGAGTIFIDRGRPKSLPGTVVAVRDALRQGDVVAAFPEGTTSCGRGLGPVRPALFEAAVAAGLPVVPVRLRYTAGSPPGRQAAFAAFIGDETLLCSLRRVLAADRLRVTVRVGTAIHPDAGSTRRVLARLAADALGSEPARVPVTAGLPERTPTAAPVTTAHAPAWMPPSTSVRGQRVPAPTSTAAPSVTPAGSLAGLTPAAGSLARLTPVA